MESVKTSSSVLDANKKAKLKYIVGMYQGMLLDCIELNYGEDPSWRNVRGQVLKILGDRGLKGKLTEAIDEQ